MTPCLVSDRSMRMHVETTTTLPGHVGHKNKQMVEQLLLLPMVERESTPTTSPSSLPRRRLSRRISDCDSNVVSFAPTVSVCEVLHLEDYTEEEIRNTWYQKNENSMIKADANLSVWMMEQQNLQQQEQHPQEEQNVLDDESTSSSTSSMSVSSSSSPSSCHCYRGLECRTKSGIAIKNRIRQQSQYAVLDVQRLVVSLSSLTSSLSSTSSDEEATTTNDNSRSSSSNNRISKMMEEEIAMVYQEYTKSCQERAHILALQDMSDIDDDRE